MPDLTQLEQELAREEEPVEVEILDKAGRPYRAPDGSVCTISVLGSDSKAYRRMREEWDRRMLREMTSGPVNGDGQDGQDEEAKEKIEKAAAVVVSWHGWTDGDEPLECTPENARRLLTYPWILRQVERGIFMHASFFVSSSGDSGGS